MIEINLLPKEFRKRSGVVSFDKEFLYIGIGVLALIILLGGTTFYQKYQLGRLDEQIARAEIEERRYQKDLELIDALTEVKEKILERLDAVDRLDRRRDYYVRMFEELNRLVPQYLWLANFSEKITQPAPESNKTPGNQQLQEEITEEPAMEDSFAKAELEGYAFSLNSIGTFMINLMKSEYFDNVRLGRTVRERVGDADAYLFKLMCDLNYDATEVTEEVEDLPEQDFQISANLEE
jgi:Tfp pilus assembly protein PilN